MQATNKQSKFNIPGGGWVTLEQDGETLTTVAEGNAAGLLVAQIAKKGMTFNEAVSYCKMCLKSEKEILQEIIEQQQNSWIFCKFWALVYDKNMDARNCYEKLMGSIEYEIRLAERRLQEINKSKPKRTEPSKEVLSELIRRLPI